MAQYIKKSALVAEIENKIKKYTKRGEESDAKRDGYGMYWGGVLPCLNEIRTLCDTLEVKEVDTLISDSRKANRAKFIKELKQKINSYERELSKSGDSTKCDDVDWVTLASDMFDTLQECLLNF